MASFKKIMFIAVVFSILTLNLYNLYDSSKALGVNDISTIDSRRSSGTVQVKKTESGYSIHLTSTTGERTINLNTNANNGTQIEEGVLYQIDNYTDKTVNIELAESWYENWYIYSINVGLLHENEISITLFTTLPSAASAMVVINLEKRPNK